MGPIERLRLWWQIQTGEEDTPLDGDTPAWLTSLALHLTALVALTLLTAAGPARNDNVVLLSKPVELADEIVPEEFHFDAEPNVEIGALSFGGTLSPEAAALTENDLSDVSATIEMPVESGQIAIVALDDPVAISPEDSSSLLVKGVGTVGVTGASGAIDRITHEILRSMEQRPTLVIWLFDQSGSLRPQRRAIHNRLDRIYHELGVVEAAGNPAFAKHQDKPLLTAVIEFGKASRFVLEKPTDQVDKIKAAIRDVREDASGQENVFQAVLTAANRYRVFRTKPRHRRNIMFVVFTDEAGDDTDGLDATVKVCRDLAMPVFVLGVPAPFGRQHTYFKYVDPDPEFDQTPQWATVDQGPESLMPERIKLHFGGSDGREESLDSGFGPFGLTRLCYETGGIYFAIHPNRDDGGHVSRRRTAEMASHLARFFDPQTMRRYRPDYISVREYNRLLVTNKARRALVEAATLSWATSLGNVRTYFPKESEPQLATDLSIAQRDAAKIEPTIRRIYDVLRLGESDREKLRKPRWQAGYDLAMGRSLAAKVRTDAYNAMLAKAKQGMKFKDSKHDTWVLVPSSEISVGSAVDKQAAKAKTYLERVVGEHEGTPWHLLAKRELRRPFGWRWSERYTGVNAPEEQAPNVNNNPRRRDDRRQMLGPRKPRRPPPAL